MRAEILAEDEASDPGSSRNAGKSLLGPKPALVAERRSRGITSKTESQPRQSDPHPAGPYLARDSDVEILHPFVGVCQSGEAAAV